MEEEYLQKEICNLKDEPLSLKKFLDEACVAEQKRKSFNEIGASSYHLDASAGVSVCKFSVGRDKYGGGRLVVRSLAVAAAAAVAVTM